jgi:hypothetical protein
MSVKGKWGVAPSSSPQMTRRTQPRSPKPLVWVTLLAVVVLIVVLLAVFL